MVHNASVVTAYTACSRMNILSSELCTTHVLRELKKANVSSMDFVSFWIHTNVVYNSCTSWTEGKRKSNVGGFHLCLNALYCKQFLYLQRTEKKRIHFIGELRTSVDTIWNFIHMSLCWPTNRNGNVHRKKNCGIKQVKYTSRSFVTVVHFRPNKIQKHKST